MSAPHVGSQFEPKNSSKIATTTLCVEIPFFFCWSIDVFVSILVSVGKRPFRLLLNFMNFVNTVGRNAFV